MKNSEKIWSRASIRRTFIAGLFAFLPMAVTAFLLWWVYDKSRVFTSWLFHRPIPFIGVLLTLAVIYAIGMVINSLIGRYFLRIVDTVIMRVPGIRLLYQAWKQIALTPGGTEGTFSRVVLIPDESGTMKLMGFSSGRLIEANEPCYCVFIPSSPNPITGRLYFIRADRCQFIQMTTEEAFKVILSTGNYVPRLLPVEPPVLNGTSF
ncbi:MAG TPA: DUF502 domain-containing protein [Tepidisphaeraceae bacterium]|jgi:uncharacterized membrane protein|nr:DUF502 domain-containing protein [Tepidisphaeraceae bacterium]